MPYIPLRRGAGRLFDENLNRMLEELFDAVADLSSTDTGKGASLVAVEDSGEVLTATDVEAALAELEARITALEP